LKKIASKREVELKKQKENKEGKEIKL